MRLIPKEEKFFDLFEELGTKIEEGINLFRTMLDDFDSFDMQLIKLKELEHEANLITHRTYKKLHKTFITPLDREDIYALVKKMNSILHSIEAAAARMSIYKIKSPAPELLQQARVLAEAVGKIRKMVHRLRDMKNSKTILQACVEIKALENEGDTLLRKTMGRLFETVQDPIELIKWREISERFEKAIDICEDVSNIAEGIVLTNA